ncbi:MAG: hypothetical protein ACI8Y4_002172 [Candidatus Poriferisodalaceae bacterium]
MTILVDQPLWSWRDRRWAHLVSDESVDELHDFAQTIGKRRVGFQGDHYDVHEQERHRAIAAGALEIDSRELVRRLRDAGLRLRGGLPKWTVLHEDEVSGSSLLADVSTRLAHIPSLAERLSQVIATPTLAPKKVGLLLLERPHEAAIVIRHLPREAVAQGWLQPARQRDGEVRLGHDESGLVLEVLQSRHRSNSARSNSAQTVDQ